MKKLRHSLSVILSTVLVFACMVFVTRTARADKETQITGPAFGNPAETQSMPAEWIKKPVMHDASVGQVDLFVSLNQQFYGFIEPLIKQYGNEHGIKIFINKGTCGISAKMLGRKQADIAGYCCPPAKLDRLPGIRFHTLGVQPLSLLVNTHCPIENISLNQARRIFQGKIRRWSELGWKNIPIQPVARLHCKKRFGHWRLLLDNEDLFGPELREVGSIPDMYGIIENTPGAVGFETISLANNNEKKIKALNIDGFAPNLPENILNGKYPFYRTIYLTSWDEGVKSSSRAVGLITYLKDQMQYVDKKFGVIPALLLRKAGWKFKDDELIGEPEISVK